MPSYVMYITKAFLLMRIIGFWNSISIGQVLEYIYIYENSRLFKNKITCLYAAGLSQHHGSGRLYEQNACNVKFNYYAYNVKFNCYAYK
jgi:hypothetical protein